MIDSQENYMSMCLRVEARLDNNDAIVITLPALVTAKSNLKQRLANIRATDLVASNKLTGVTLDKVAARNIFNLICLQYAGILCSFASNTSNNTLYEEMYKSETEVKRLRDDQLPVYAQLIISRLNTFVAQLSSYGITPATITDFETNLATYQLSSPSPRYAISSRKAANASLKTQFFELRKFMKKELDTLVLKFKISEPLFVEEYFNDRNIYDDGSSNNVLETFEGIIAALAIANLGNLKTGALKLRITLINGGPVEIGLSIDGTTFNGNTTAIAGVGTETIIIEDLNSIGTIILIRNQNASVQAQYKVEVLR